MEAPGGSTFQMIQATGITKRYGRFTAVQGLDLEVPDGVVCGLLGPNGAGKTTTIRMVTGMLPPDEGTLRVAGHPMPAGRRRALARLGYLPESAPSYPEMRVAEYLRFRGRILGLDRGTIRRTADAALGACDLAGVARRLVGQLSKGFRQRVGLAAALLGDPALLVLDEPTVGLDPRQLRDFRRLVRRLAEERTILLSSHIMQEIEAVADRVVIMHRGRKLADGTIDELRRAAPGRNIGRVSIADDRRPALESALRAIASKNDDAEIEFTTVSPGELRFEFAGPDLGRECGGAIHAADGVAIELGHESPGLESRFLELLDLERGSQEGAAP